MIRHTLQEWSSIDVGEGRQDALTRAEADRLLAVARAAKIGGPDGETILVDGHRRLRAQQVVGILAAPGVSLEILPKIDGLGTEGVRRNLVHMLARVFDLEISDGRVTELGWQRDDLLEILIRLFCERLFEAIRRGLARRYVAHQDDLRLLRGRLDVIRQFTVLAASPQSIACRYDDLSADIALNRIMKAAVTRLSAITRSPVNQRSLAELALAFSDVTLPAGSALPWDHVVLDRTSSAWADLVSLARLLLGDRFQTTSSGDAPGFSLLFEMNTLFEEYVGRTLKRALAGSGLEVRLQGPPNHLLIDQADVRRFATRPDIVISRDRRPLMIIDTKWKRLATVLDNPKQGVGQADIYQMMGYAHVYGVERLMLLYPHHGGLSSPEGVLNRHRVIGTADTELSIACVDLGRLGSVGSRLADLVTGGVESDPDQAAARISSQAFELHGGHA